jgi:hypothetical protein
MMTLKLLVVGLGKTVGEKNISSFSKKVRYDTEELIELNNGRTSNQKI